VMRAPGRQPKTKPSAAPGRGAATSWPGRRLGRSPAALRLRAVKLGLTQPPRRRRWQPAEDHRLRTGYAHGLTCGMTARPAQRLHPLRDATVPAHPTATIGQTSRAGDPQYELAVGASCLASSPRLDELATAV
jgi:hypothetical protein